MQYPKQRPSRLPFFFADAGSVDVSRFSCPKVTCPDYGKRRGDNLAIMARYGTHQRRLLRCLTCKTRFSERRGTGLFKARLPDHIIEMLLHYLGKGFSIRQISRLVGVNKNTVLRFAWLTARKRIKRT